MDVKSMIHASSYTSILLCKKISLDSVFWT